MKTVFADTGFWIALLHPGDRWHQKAIALYKSLEKQRTVIVTSEMVLVEYLNFFTRFSAKVRQQAAQTVLQMQNHPNITIVAASSELFAQSLHLYQHRGDKAWSLTDCSSFVIMESNQIAQALAHDKHFEQAGFQALMR